MGSLLCCLRADDLEEQEHHASLCCTCCIPPLGALFQWRGQVTHSAEHGTAPLRSTSLEDNSLFDTFQSPPRPLPFDDPRCSPSQSLFDGKASRYLQEESQTLKYKSVSQTEKTGKKEKSNESKYEEQFRIHTLLEMTSGVAHIFSTPEDEDACPICLEEYVPENPKITLQCTHHFHLSCIYEWMERSDTCPVCGKMMLFDEER